MLPGDEEVLERILKSLPVSKFKGPVYRIVPLKYFGSWDSTEGARRLGGRFNPLHDLAESLCRVKDGFGLLYTATNPITCLFECQHILRTDTGSAFQSIPKEPKILLTFHAESDRVLDLRSSGNLASLGLTQEEVVAPDDRYDLNEEGRLTPLQRLEAAGYKTGRFSGILAPSRHNDVVAGDCFDFLPREVRPMVHDPEGSLGRMWLR